MRTDVKYTITARGKTQSASQWARELGLNENTLRHRVKMGYTGEDALSVINYRKNRVSEIGASHYKRKSLEKNQNLNRGTLCWLCGNYCGGCSWTRNFIPVEGWEAEEDVIKEGKPSYTKNGYVREIRTIKSYKVKKCPEFWNDTYKYKRS